MTIDWNSFTPWPALAGGALIGLAAALLLLLNGRIAGISGVLGGLFKPVKGDIAWRAAFVLGLVGAPLAYPLFARLPVPRIDADYAALIVAGLLVGVEPATARAAPADMASAAWLACRRAPWLPPLASWLLVLLPCS